MEFRKTFGDDLKAGVASVAGPHFSSDGNAYAYIYIQVLSQAYVVTGLRQESALEARRRLVA